MGKLSHCYPLFPAVSFLLAHIVRMPDGQTWPGRVAQGDGVGGNEFIKSVPLPLTLLYPFYSSAFWSLSLLAFPPHSHIPSLRSMRILVNPVCLSRSRSLFAVIWLWTIASPPWLHSHQSPHSSSWDQWYLLFTSALHLILRPCHSVSSNSR